MINRYPRLQSGFIARTEEPFVKPKEREPNIIRPLLVRPPNNTQDEYFYSQAFDLLYERYLMDATSFNVPAKQVEMFQILKQLYAGQGWASFVRLQENNPNLSDLHVQFMAETTLMLTFFQERRRASLPTWASLLSNANQPVRAPFRTASTNIRKGLTFAQAFNDYRFLAELDKTLLCWIQTYGLSDLMMATKVIFGRRSIHATRGRAN